MSIMSSGDSPTNEESLPEQFVLAKFWACLRPIHGFYVRDAFPCASQIYIHSHIVYIPTHHVHTNWEQGHLPCKESEYFVVQALGVC